MAVTIPWRAFGLFFVFAGIFNFLIVGDNEIKGRQGNFLQFFAAKKIPQLPLRGYGQQRCLNDTREKTLKTIGLLAPMLFVSSMATTANAIECMDTRITVAIKQIAGRAPKPVECNLAIYRVPPGHLEFDLAVKEALAILEKKTVNGLLTTQELWRLPEIVNTERR